MTGGSVTRISRFKHAPTIPRSPTPSRAVWELSPPDDGGTLVGKYEWSYLAFVLAPGFAIFFRRFPPTMFHCEALRTGSERHCVLARFGYDSEGRDW